MDVVRPGSAFSKLHLLHICDTLFSSACILFCNTLRNNNDSDKKSIVVKKTHVIAVLRIKTSGIHWKVAVFVPCKKGEKQFLMHDGLFFSDLAIKTKWNSFILGLKSGRVNFKFNIVTFSLVLSWSNISWISSFQSSCSEWNESTGISKKPDSSMAVSWSRIVVNWGLEWGSELQQSEIDEKHPQKPRSASSGPLDILFVDLTQLCYIFRGFIFCSSG